jgi:hypothetical protein
MLKLTNFASDIWTRVLKCSLGRAFLIVWIVSFTVLVSYAIHSNRELAEDGQHAHDKLCEIRHNLVLRVARTNAFLEENPEGVPGISVKFITDSINTDQRTVDALASLDCAEDEMGG